MGKSASKSSAWSEKKLEIVIAVVLFIILGIVGWGAHEIYSQNREGGTAAIGLSSLKEDVGTFRADTKDNFSAIRNDLNSFKTDIKDSLTSFKAEMKEGQSQAKSDFALAKQTIDEIKQNTRDITSSIADVRVQLAGVARDALWQEFGKTRASAQFGKFSDATKVQGPALEYDWKLQQPVNPQRVLFVLATTIQPLPGLEISAAVNEDGTQCRMNVVGTNADSLKKLADGVDAQVYIIAEPVKRGR
jgi:hypothetical protein